MMDLYLRDNVERLLGGRKEAPSPDFRARLEQALRARPESRPRRPAKPILGQLSLAAAALLGLGMLLLFPPEPIHKLSRGSVRLGDGRTLTAPATLQQSPSDDLEALEDTEMIFSEGSAARLTKGTRLRIHSGDRSMKKALVITLLAGSASFSNPKGPVEATAGQVALLEIGEAPRLRMDPQERQELTAPEVIAWMERETKKKFIYTEDMGLKHKRLQGTLDARDPEQVYEIGLNLLKTLDLAAVPLEDGQGTIRLVPAPLGQKLAKVYTAVEQLPKADEFCTLSLVVKYAWPRDVQAMLINKIHYPQNCQALESPPTIVLSDYASNLRALAGIVRQIDVKAAVPPNYRIALALLEGSNDKEPGVPEEFRKVDLAGAVSRNRFLLLAESSASIDGKESYRGKPTPTTLRLTGPVPLQAEFKGTAKAERITLTELTVRRDVTPAGAGPLLTNQVELGLGAWRILGSFTGEKEGTVLVILARATQEQ